MRVTAAELADALEALEPGCVLERDISIRLVVPGGLRLHVNAEDGHVRVQAVPADPQDIPHGDFCYAPGRVSRDARGQVSMSLSPCPHFVVTGGMEAFCRFLDSPARGTPLWDQVKVCGVASEPTPQAREEAERLRGEWDRALGA